MKRAIVTGILAAMFITMLAACGNTEEAGQRKEAQNMPSYSVKAESKETEAEKETMSDFYTVDTAISDVTGDPAFGDYGRLIFPVDDWYYSAGIRWGNCV